MTRLSAVYSVTVDAECYAAVELQKYKCLYNIPPTYLISLLAVKQY